MRKFSHCMSSAEARRCTSVPAKGRYNFNRWEVLSQRLLISSKWEKCSYPLLAVNPCLPCHQDLHNNRGIPWWKVSFTKYLILHWFEVILAFTSPFRTAESPPPRLYMETVGQWAEWRRLLVVKSHIWTVHPSTALSQWQQGQVTEDAFRPFVKEQWLCYHRARTQTKILTRSLIQGLGLFFSCCVQVAGAQKHIFVLPVTN